MKAFILSVYLCLTLVLASFTLQAQSLIQTVETIKKEVFKIQKPYVIHQIYDRDLSMPTASMTEVKRYGIQITVLGENPHFVAGVILEESLIPQLSPFKMEDIAEIEILPANHPKTALYGCNGAGHVLVYLKSYWNTLSEIAKKDIRRNSYRHYPPFK
jgi:hypothetical protein